MDHPTPFVQDVPRSKRTGPGIFVLIWLTGDLPSDQKTGEQTSGP